MVREYMGLNYEAAGEGFGDVNSEGGARWGFEGVSASSARIVMKVEQDGAFGGHLGERPKERACWSYSPTLFDDAIPTLNWTAEPEPEPGLQ
ncbi:hypothetical protein V6N12_060426 [Hibiscus sabdariffa]|uniref:Uncharacterized protein n=1 Tax=Hibiscus sabdariffa TaxID=183260 RepID=A0ABR2D4D6_9ROSI